MTTRYPLPAHSRHSIPATNPVPRQPSHGIGIFSFIGGFVWMSFSDANIHSRQDFANWANRLREIVVTVLMVRRSGATPHPAHAGQPGSASAARSLGANDRRRRRESRSSQIRSRRRCFATSRPRSPLMLEAASCGPRFHQSEAQPPNASLIAAAPICHPSQPASPVPTAKNRPLDRQFAGFGHP
jgi:hypothetical protein